MNLIPFEQLKPVNRGSLRLLRGRLGSLACALMLPGILQAQSIINIDITSSPSLYQPSSTGDRGVIGRASGVSWNAVGNTELRTRLLDENGVETGASFQLTGNLVTTADENNLTNTFRIASRGTSGFFQSYAFLSNSDTPGTADESTFTIGGLSNAIPADLYFYATWGWGDAGTEFRVSGDGGSTWTAWKLANGIPSTSTAPFSEGNSYVIFTNITAHSDGTILGEWKTTLAGGSTQNRGPFNAVQIVATPEPPPPVEPIEQTLAVDAQGDLFLHLENLPYDSNSIVQEKSALTDSVWTNRFPLSGITSTDVIVSADKPSRFFRVETAPSSPVMLPNMVMILAEDCSKHWYDIYDPAYGTATPNIQALANSGLVFENAFCHVAVCSAARSTLISGCDPTRIGVQWHRKTSSVQLSNGLLPFPAYLRKAGYYTTNSTKTDYNLIVNNAWDNAAAPKFGWQARPTPTTPFLHVRTMTTSHESSIRSAASIASPVTDTNSVSLYPIHPDTDIFRRTYATYTDKIHAVDTAVGELVSALQADGLLDDTFIFFIGDNGGTVAGSKGYITNTGLHVPLVVYVPSNWTHLVPATPDGRVDGFVGFEDLGATLLNLAGLGIPKEMDGKPFLGEGIPLEQINSRDTVFFSADRFDEAYNVIRSIQTGRFKYIRHYEPFYPYALYNQYRYGMECQLEWKQLYDAGTLNSAQSRFFEPRQGEELYDLAADPFETNNLAIDPGHAALLTQLRTNLLQRVTQLPDIGIIPESVFLQEGGHLDPVNYGKSNRQRISRYVDIADLMLDSYSHSEAALQTHLASSDPLDRYWALTACAAFGSDAAALEATVTAMIATETNPLVLARAAVFLGELAAATATVEVALKNAVLSCVDQTDSLLVLNDAVHLQDTLGYTFSTISPSAVVGTSNWLDNRTLRLGW